MSHLNLKQQTVDSWTVTHDKTGVLIAWITKLQNKLDNNQTYQLIIRSEMTHAFMGFDRFDTLEAVTAFISNARCMGGDV